jgi:large subunit ribosomal protein L18
MKKVNKRKRRHKRVKKKVLGTSQRPRLNVYRSNTHFYAQFIDDIEKRVIMGVSTSSEEFKKKHEQSGTVEAAKHLGKLMAEKAKKNKIDICVFDRSGYLYHGRVKAFAESLREAGLKF